MKTKLELIAVIARLVVWVLVAVWCFVPLIWALFLWLSSAGQANVNQPQVMRPMPMDQGVMMKLMGSAFLVATFVYGLWCTAGVAMGFGFDRVITIAESLGALLTRRRQPESEGD